MISVPEGRELEPISSHSLLAVNFLCPSEFENSDREGCHGREKTRLVELVNDQPRTVACPAFGYKEIFQAQASPSDKRQS